MKFAHKGELARYYSMPKEFVGPEAADDLFRVHEALVQNESSFGYLFAAGSAAAESGLMAYNTPIGERHDRIDAARKAWLGAQDAFLFKHITEDWNEARMMCQPDKVQVQLSFIDIYHEMVDGYVEESTLGRLHATLVRLASHNKELHDYSDAIGDWSTAAGRRGLGYEIGTHLPVTRLGCPSFFTVPSTARADHGGTMGRQTHDVRLIQQTHGVIKWCVPFEVKPTDYYSEDYDSALVRGRVELLMPSSLHPLELADYALAELEGTISEQHLGELDDITSRVLRLAKDYRAREEFDTLVLQSA